MVTANSSKKHKVIVNLPKNLPLHTHDEDHFHHPLFLEFVSGPHTECNLIRDKKKHNVN